MGRTEILSDYDLRTAITELRRAGFRTYVLERGTICAYRNKSCYGFGPRHGRFGREAIQRAITQENAPLAEIG